MSQYIGVPGLEAEWHEACQLAKDLGIAVQELGAVYTQLAGHAAAAHAVVHDLQRCMAFLSSRHAASLCPQSVRDNTFKRLHALHRWLHSLAHAGHPQELAPCPGSLNNSPADQSAAAL